MTEFFLGKNIADSSDINISDASISSYADPTITLSVKRELQSYGDDFLRKLSLLASLNGIEKVKISQFNVASPGGVLYIDGTASARDLGEQLSRLATILRHQFLLSRYHGKKVKICRHIFDQNDLETKIEKFYSQAAKDIAHVKQDTRRMEICNENYFEGHKVVLDINDPNHYGERDLNSSSLTSDLFDPAHSASSVTR